MKKILNSLIRDSIYSDAIIASLPEGGNYFTSTFWLRVVPSL